jgi:hypothetical protein
MSNFPHQQPAPESASGTWAKRYEKKFGRPPQTDGKGGYKVNGQVCHRPGKTRWDKSPGSNKEE